VKKNNPKNQFDIQSLIELSKKGDKQAFGKIYLHFADDIYRYALFKVSDQNDAKDITSETFKKVWSYIDRYKQQNFKAFLYTVAKNLIIDHYKSVAKNKTIRLEKIEWIKDSNINLEKDLKDQEETTKILKKLRKLKASYREVLILRLVQELSIKETASIMKKSSGAVRVLQHRALIKLKKLVKQNNSEK
jgi:RNA polymerase sigma-70 factor, ECF subfamily